MGKHQEKTGKKKRRKASYNKALAELQAELVKLQLWVKESGARVIVVFEGRDAAGKGGAIKRITERTSPRVFRVAALPAPSERERSQIYYQRYIKHFPAAGEVVLFDRSWYNRLGVERVMGFCTEEEYQRFKSLCPEFEASVLSSGVIVLKYWFEVSMEEQTRRFEARLNDPRKVWKLSPMDLESHARWHDYTVARDEMFAATDTAISPWHVVQADDKKSARLNCIAHLLASIPYQKVKRSKVKLPPRQKKKEEPRSSHPFRYVESRYTFA